MSGAAGGNTRWYLPSAISQAPTASPQPACAAWPQARATERRPVHIRLRDQMCMCVSPPLRPAVPSSDGQVIAPETLPARRLRAATPGIPCHAHPRGRQCAPPWMRAGVRHTRGARRLVWHGTKRVGPRTRLDFHRLRYPRKEWRASQRKGACPARSARISAGARRLGRAARRARGDRRVGHVCGARPCDRHGADLNQPAP